MARGSVTTPDLFHKIRVRVHKRDSAFVYCILESHEGTCSYSTLDGPANDLYRDLELQVPESALPDVRRVLEHLGERIHECGSE